MVNAISPLAPRALDVSENEEAEVTRIAGRDGLLNTPEEFLKAARYLNDQRHKEGAKEVFVFENNSLFSYRILLDTSGRGGILRHDFKLNKDQAVSPSPELDCYTTSSFNVTDILSDGMHVFVSGPNTYDFDNFGVVELDSTISTFFDSFESHALLWEDSKLVYQDGGQIFLEGYLKACKSHKHPSIRAMLPLKYDEMLLHHDHCSLRGTAGGA